VTYIERNEEYEEIHIENQDDLDMFFEQLSKDFALDILII